jgi:hypothetical protein
MWVEVLWWQIHGPRNPIACLTDLSTVSELILNNNRLKGKSIKV